MKHPMNIVAILAGGVGSRMGADRPKQFLPLGDGMVIECTIDAFHRHDGIDAIVLVVHHEWLDFVRQMVAKHRWQKVKSVVEGGKERYHSSMSAIKAACELDCDARLLIHDAARPLVSQRIIGDVLSALDSHRAVVVGLPSTDTIWQVSFCNGQLPTVDSVTERKRMYRAQTPQAFHMSLLANAYDRVLGPGGLQPTDDCGVVRAAFPDEPVAVVEGEVSNIKITTPEDLVYAQALIKKESL